jgi:hypothetical protein
MVMLPTGQEVQLIAQQRDARASMSLIKPLQIILSRLAYAF